jgi:glutathione S-transferase
LSEYQLYCFAQSGNAYRAALMLNLIGADWEPRYVDFFAKGETRTPEFRADVNEMGEAPVLVHGDKKLSQSGVILTYLAERSGKFLPSGDDERLEALRWIIFDNQKLNGYLGPFRFLKNWARPTPNPAILDFLKGRIVNSLAILDKRLSGRAFVLGERPTIADLSLVAYLYYPADEFGFDIAA